jgi:hypothetical protein
LIHLKVLTCRILNFRLFIYEECIIVLEILLIVWAIVLIKCDMKTKKELFFLKEKFFLFSWFLIELCVFNLIVFYSHFDYSLFLIWISLIFMLIDRHFFLRTKLIMSRWLWDVSLRFFELKLRLRICVVRKKLKE